MRMARGDRSRCATARASSRTTSRSISTRSTASSTSLLDLQLARHADVLAEDVAFLPALVRAPLLLVLHVRAALGEAIEALVPELAHVAALDAGQGHRRRRLPRVVRRVVLARVAVRLGVDVLGVAA